jgi:hypothetical protein
MRKIMNWRKLEIALIVILGSIIVLDLVYVWLVYEMSSQFDYMWKNF